MSATDPRDHVDAETPAERLWDALRKQARNMALDLRVAAPATVVTFDATAQTAAVTLGYRSVPDDGIEVPDPPLQIPGVRVEFPSAAGGTSYDTYPILPGDTGVLTFHDRALDEWYRTGGAVDPNDARTHSLADATFRPTLRPDTATLPPVDLTARVLEATLIKLGASAAPPVGGFLLKGTPIATAAASAKATLIAVPPPTDPVPSVNAAIIANTAAIIALLDAITSNISTKVSTE